MAAMCQLNRIGSARSSQLLHLLLYIWTRTAQVSWAESRSVKSGSERKWIDGRDDIGDGLDSPKHLNGAWLLSFTILSLSLSSPDPPRDSPPTRHRAQDSPQEFWTPYGPVPTIMPQPQPPSPLQPGSPVLWDRSSISTIKQHNCLICPDVAVRPVIEQQVQHQALFAALRLSGADLITCVTSTLNAQLPAHHAAPTGLLQK
ncbi:hypothetical protein FIBSPDRAFT_894408 [Athelia psychrophila]|uniref:Uncharacterized protein n=1 Tax=Athelia psychrophila TaxID=1759441 RepID=A0A166FYK4_9AGAM|nr:hypothetical protein FIBSPDRAFT_894408 [Fibularhizoctonia sp. CBS 109695]